MYRNDCNNRKKIIVGMRITMMTEIIVIVVLIVIIRMNIKSALMLGGFGAKLLCRVISQKCSRNMERRSIDGKLLVGT